MGRLWAAFWSLWALPLRRKRLRVLRRRRGCVWTAWGALGLGSGGGAGSALDVGDAVVDPDREFAELPDDGGEVRRHRDAAFDLFALGHVPELSEVFVQEQPVLQCPLVGVGSGAHDGIERLRVAAEYLSYLLARAS